MPDIERRVASKDIFFEEESMLQRVHSSFEKKISEQTAAYISERDYVSSSNFEEQDKQIHFSSANKELIKQIGISKLYSSLRDNPYFAHIKLKDKSRGDMIHCLMSDNEELDEAVTIQWVPETMIVPFKQDTSREIYNELFHLYQEKTGKEFTANSYEYHPEFIRTDDIINAELISAAQIFPMVETDEGEFLDCDELLNEKLKRNRKNKALSNIISTLQKQQYEIIQTNPEISFAVQGCAGSGKSQCLIHRLFFLRDVFAGEWDKVLLITPSKLFRNYSADLMKRYRLTSIQNTSIAWLYKSVLDKIDSRFKNRQYRFEMSEEYLPDTYLHEVYTKENIDTIRDEIERAIFNHVSEACAALNRSVGGEITRKYIDELVVKLEKEIADFDMREDDLAKDKELSEARRRLEDLTKEASTLKTAQNRLQKRKAELADRRGKFEELIAGVEQAEKDKKQWLDKCNNELSEARRKLAEESKLLDEIAKQYGLMAGLTRYSDAVNGYMDMIVPGGIRKKEIADYNAFLEDYLELTKSELKEFIGEKTEKAWVSQLHRDEVDIEKRIAANAETIAVCDRNYKETSDWLVQHMEDSRYRDQNSKRRAKLERERYYLSRIESAVFEQEVWNALAGLKERSNIKTIDIDESGERRKETRILYKSDLLFYLYIYVCLGEIEGLKKYRLICVDEGQDLHAADYELLEKLFPTAKFNIFGDVAQSLHEDCGISDWKNETPIERVYALTKNYRNPPAIVDFCNKSFAEQMEYCGTIDEAQQPTKLHSNKDIVDVIEKERPTIIVKNRESFEALAKIVGEKLDLDYLDSEAQGENPERIACYSIFAAKGLEFEKVMVYPKNMSHNEKVVSCTRAMEYLYYIDMEELS